MRLLDKAKKGICGHPQILVRLIVSETQIPALKSPLLQVELGGEYSGCILGLYAVSNLRFRNWVLLKIRDGV